MQYLVEFEEKDDETVLRLEAFLRSIGAVINRGFGVLRESGDNFAVIAVDMTCEEAVVLSKVSDFFGIRQIVDRMTAEARDPLSGCDRDDYDYSYDDDYDDD